MDIRDKIYDIIYGNDKSDIDIIIDNIKNFMSNLEDVTSYVVDVDNDVFDSPGLTIYYIMIAWNDSDGLHQCGCSYELY